MMSARKIGTYVALLAIIIGGAPYFTGYLVEAKFKDVIHVISDIRDISIKLVKYDRGWRQSFAQTEITFKGNYARSAFASLEGLTLEQKGALEEQGATITLNYNIAHGPFVHDPNGSWKDWRFALAILRSKIALSDETHTMLEKMQKTFSQKQLLGIYGVFSIDGSVQINLESLPFKVMNGKTEVINWQGAQWVWKLNREMKHSQAVLSFPELLFQLGGKSFSLLNVSSSYDKKKSPEDLWLGRIDGKCEMLSVRDQMDPTNNIELKGIQFDSQSGSQAGLIGATATIDVQQLNIMSKILGPLNISSSVKKIDALFVKEVINFSKKINHAKDQAEQAELARALVAKISQFLKNRPEMSIDNFSIKTENGEVIGDASFAVGGEKASNVNNMAEIVQSIVAKADAIFPKTTLIELLTVQYTQKVDGQPGMTVEQMKKIGMEKANQIIDQALKDGYIVEKDNNYATQWEYAAGQLKVNGKAMAFPMGQSSSQQPTGTSSAIPSSPPAIPKASSM